MMVAEGEGIVLFSLLCHCLGALDGCVGDRQVSELFLYHFLTCSEI